MAWHLSSTLWSPASHLWNQTQINLKRLAHVACMRPAFACHVKGARGHRVDWDRLVGREVEDHGVLGRDDLVFGPTGDRIGALKLTSELDSRVAWAGGACAFRPGGRQSGFSGR